MNIDNGIGAGAFAALICKRMSLRSHRKDDLLSTHSTTRRPRRLKRL